MVAAPGTALSDLQSNILKVLAASAAPKNATAIGKALPVGGRPKPKQLTQVLSEMAAAGSIVVLPGKTAKFVRAPVEAWAQAWILETLEKGKQSEAQLSKALSPHEHLLGDVIKRLKREGKVFVHLPTGAKDTPVSYALVPPDPMHYIGTDLEKLLQKAKAKGFSPAQIRRAVLSQLPAEPPPIIETIRQLEPRADLGVTVPIPRLRRALSAKHDQASIDKEILELAAQGGLDLHSHPWPARLSADEKKSFIADGHGGWFDSVALRRTST